ncbi:hypothetical protein UNDKW_3960 [Undibacterium sp. KW1]|jgi:ribosome-binding protein aMBF1 (putative translation factor)|uniref:helix-turn-helix domain-containing protein n=1 Tax=Undibacterium sp. KW1 TaxID=2058624 RepID=UPI001331C98F|nr:hypothetical protein UNDKW_3960 [Undibacterium sp. KW1]
MRIVEDSRQNQNISEIQLNVHYSNHYVYYKLWTVRHPNWMLTGMKKSKNLLSSKEIFGRNLRRARRHKEISQEDLALRSDLSRSYVSGVERGIRNVSIDNMDLLAQALGIPIRDLLDPDLFAYVDDKLE